MSQGGRGRDVSRGLQGAEHLQGAEGPQEPLPPPTHPQPPHEIYKLFLHGKAQMPADSSPRREAQSLIQGWLGAKWRQLFWAEQGAAAGRGLEAGREGWLLLRAGQLGLETREAQAWP